MSRPNIIRPDIFRLQQRPPEDDIDFPLGLGVQGVHEICEAAFGDMASLTGFAIAASGALKGTLAWVSQFQLGFDHGRALMGGVASFQRSCPQSIHICLRKRSEVLWTVEEAICSRAVSLVIAEIEDVDFTASRRLTLASRRCGVPVILLMPYTREGATAAQARWRICASPSAPNVFDPAAPGNPRWQAELVRSRAAPHMAGRLFNLEFDHETLSLNLATRMAANTAAPRLPGAENLLPEADWKWRA